MPLKIPAWDEMHPIIIHFPIALILIAPIFIFTGIIYKKYDKCAWLSSFILMTIGTIFSMFAVATGKASASLIDKTEETEKIIINHWKFGEISRTYFIILTIIYALYLFVLPKIIKRELTRKENMIFNLIFLIVFLIGCAVISYTGHLGGSLVHEYGISSWAFER